MQSSLEVSRQSSVGTSSLVLYYEDTLSYVHMFMRRHSQSSCVLTLLWDQNIQPQSLEHGFCLTWLLKVFVLSLSPHHQAVTNLSLVT